MSNKCNSKPNPEGPLIYQIRIKGHLDHQWADWFENATITQEDNGDTLLTLPVVDQAALHGLLKKIRDLGMPLLSVNRIVSNPKSKNRSKKEKQMTVEKSLHPSEKSVSANRVSKREGVSETNSIQKTAGFAGILYLIITVAAIIAHIYVPSNIVVPGDAAATAINIMNNETLFRFGAIGGELIVLLSEIILSVVLYVILKPVNKTLSLLAAVSRLAMTTIHGLNLINYFFVLLLLGGGYSTVFAADQLQALVTLFLDAHSYGFTIGIAFLTIHVFILGYLIFKSGYFPRILGILFIAAGFGYLVDSFALLLSSSYTTTPGFIQAVIAISEIAFPLWLLIKGVNLEGWKKRALVTD